MSKQRRVILFTALAGVLAWSYWLAIQSDSDAEDNLVADVVVSKKTRIIVAPPARPAPTQSTVGTARMALSASSVNLFPKQTWYVAPPPPPPPPPQPPPPPPPPPQAPALPFTYMGHWLENGKTVYYLMRGNEPLAVQAGQVVDGVWRLEPVRGQVLDFTYVPLNQTRSLRIGE